MVCGSKKDVKKHCLTIVRNLGIKKALPNPEEPYYIWYQL